jgi:uncharacterized protein (TIGR04255 family)
MVKELKNKPLIEAICEVRWGLEGTSPAPQTDAHYKLLLGRLFDRMLNDYPNHEQLPTANMPDELVGHVVQHRFRVAANSWPLVQVGPGVFAVNSTDDYKWGDFRPRALSAVKKLFEAHPKVADLKITNLNLRYINAVDFDCEADNAFEYLKDNLKLNISLPTNLFDGSDVENKPSGLVWQSSFKCEKPKGTVTIRFATGQRSNKPLMVWETTVESAGDNLPDMPNGFEGWLDEAHKLTDDWFFKIIEGNLERRFSGE